MTSTQLYAAPFAYVPNEGSGTISVIDTQTDTVVDEININLTIRNLTKVATWFISKPCVPISAVQHASGRMEKIDSQNVYLTIGDLGFSQIDKVDIRQDLGSVFLIFKFSPACAA